MAKLFLTTLPSQEELHQTSCQIFPEAEPLSLYSNLLFRKVATDIEINYDNFFAQFDLSPGRFTLIMLLKKNPAGLMPSELAQKVGVTQATISGLINSLEKSEIVARETHEKDGRAFVIKLTAKGNALIQKLAPEWYPKIMGFWAQLTQEEKTTLNGILEKMSKNMHLLK